jgi:hypothetical protein
LDLEVSDMNDATFDKPLAHDTPHAPLHRAELWFPRAAPAAPSFKDAANNFGRQIFNRQILHPPQHAKQASMMN